MLRPREADRAMRAGEEAKATAPPLLPLAMFLVHKCPFCLLSLFAAERVP
jgi:hypothetical protein